LDLTGREDRTIMYYLERAPENKKNFEANNFTAQQLNVVLTMMRQCWKLRQGAIINNLLEASLPEGFVIEENLKEGQDGKEYKTYQVVSGGIPN